MNKPKLVTIVGLSGSGKSDFSKFLADEDGGYNIYSSSKRREELQKQSRFYSDGQMFAQLIKDIIKDLEDGKNVIFDSTNLTVKIRSKLLNKVKNKNIDCHKKCIVLDTPFDNCVRNIERFYGNKSEEFILSQLEKYEKPTTEEGFDEVEII